MLNELTQRKSHLYLLEKATKVKRSQMSLQFERVRICYVAYLHDSWKVLCDVFVQLFAQVWVVGFVVHQDDLSHQVGGSPVDDRVHRPDKGSGVATDQN